MMIRINLAKSAGKKSGGGSSVAVRLLLILLLAAAGGVYYYLEYMHDGDADNPIDNLIAKFFTPAEEQAAAVKKADEAFDKLIGDVIGVSDSGDAEPSDDDAEPTPSREKAVASAPEPVEQKVASAPPAAPEPVSEPTRRTEPRQTRPSSLVRSNMVEDVVRELGSETRAVNKLNASYEEMTVAEKINYEVLFGRNVFEMITRNTPAGVRLRTLEIENFQTVYASGVGASREIVQDMFAAFRNERGELLPRPLSYIRDDEHGGGYRFVITFKPRFGLELSDPFQALDHLGFRESLTTNLRRFTHIAGANGFRIVGEPRQISAERSGSYRRMVYGVSGTSTYKDFHKFVLALHSEKVPCALKKVTLTPVRGDDVRVNAEILFTVKQ